MILVLVWVLGFYPEAGPLSTEVGSVNLLKVKNTMHQQCGKNSFTESLALSAVANNLNLSKLGAQDNKALILRPGHILASILEGFPLCSFPISLGASLHSSPRIIYEGQEGPIVCVPPHIGEPFERVTEGSLGNWSRVVLEREHVFPRRFLGRYVPS